MITNISDADIQQQVRKAWSPSLEAALMQKTPLRTIGLYNNSRQGEVPVGGDSVKISQVIDEGEEADLRTIGVDADSFTSRKLKTRNVNLTIDKVVQDAVEWDKYVDIQTILNPSAEAIDKISNTIARRIESFIRSFIAPDTAYTGVAALDIAELLKGRTQASKDFWPDGQRRWLVVDPDYYEDILGEEKYINLDYGAGENTVSQGLIAKEVSGWTVVEDNSQKSRYALGLNGNWLFYAEAQMDVNYYNLLSQKQKVQGVMVDMPLGAVLSNNGSKLHYTWTP